MTSEKRASMQSTAYEFIKHKITMCEYAPNQLLSEALLQEELGFSRTPVREAIGRLEQEGLVKILPKKGIMVSDLSLSQINMIYETRMMLEPYAILHYGNRIEQDVYMKYYQDYQAYLKGADLPYSYDDMDDLFHQMFIDATSNVYFLKTYELINSQIKRMRIMSGECSEKRPFQDPGPI